MPLTGHERIESIVHGERGLHMNTCFTGSQRGKEQQMGVDAAEEVDALMETCESSVPAMH